MALRGLVGDRAGWRRSGRRSSAATSRPAAGCRRSQGRPAAPARRARRRCSAIAHSTWSHGSTCPSGQPIAPSARCAAAIERAVRSTPSGGAGPGPAPGLSVPHREPRARSDESLSRVDDEALADERVERRLGEPGERGRAHDVPDEQPVVGRGRRGGGRRARRPRTSATSTGSAGRARGGCRSPRGPPAASFAVSSARVKMRTCPPGTSWYSPDSAQQTRSGSQRGHGDRREPAGRSTRAISASARRSPGRAPGSRRR